MAYPLSVDQFNNVSANSTRPIYLVQLQYAATIEYLSTSGPIKFDGVDYVAGGVDVENIASGQRVSLSLFASASRVAETVSGTWRGAKLCKVFAIPAAPASEPIYTLDQGIPAIDGYIDTARVSGNKISVVAIHKHYANAYTPRLNCSELSIYTPPAGSVFTWQGGSYTLASKR